MTQSKEASDDAQTAFVAQLEAGDVPSNEVENDNLPAAQAMIRDIGDKTCKGATSDVATDIFTALLDEEVVINRRAALYDSTRVTQRQVEHPAAKHQLFLRCYSTRRA